MKQLLSFAFLILVLNVTAQVTYTFSPLDQAQKEIRFNEILGGDENYFYVHKISTVGNGVTHFIQQISRKTMLATGIKELVISEDGFSFGVNRLIFNDDELIVFVNKNNKKTTEVIFSAITYDISSLSKIKETVLTSCQMESYSTPKVNVKVNSSNAVAAVKISGVGKIPKEIFTEFVLFDISKSTKLWNKKIVENDKEYWLTRNMLVTSNGIVNNSDDFEVDNDNNIHYVFYSVSPNTPKFEVSWYDLNYTFINGKTLNVTRYPLLADFKCDMRNARIGFLANKNIAISGIYYDKGSKGELVSNFFNYIIDPFKGQILSKNFKPAESIATEDFVEEKKFKLAKNFFIDNVFSTAEGCFLVGHKGRGKEMYGQYSPNVSYTAFPALYFKLFYVKINNDGSFEYLKTLPFLSNPTSANYLYHAEEIIKQHISLVYNHSLYIIYNEHPVTTKNWESKTPGAEVKVANVSGSAKNIVCNKIDLKTGLNTRTVIELPVGDRFNPVKETDLKLSHPVESAIYDTSKTVVTLPLESDQGMQKFLSINLE